MQSNVREADLRVGIHILTHNDDYNMAKADTLLADYPWYHRGPSTSHQWTVQFENGYGASVITGPTAFCSKEHPYELAVLHNDRLCYTSPITDDVIGHLNLQELEGYLDRIVQLKRT